MNLVLIIKKNYIPDPNIGTTTRQPLLMADSWIRRIAEAKQSPDLLTAITSAGKWVNFKRVFALSPKTRIVQSRHTRTDFPSTGARKSESRWGGGGEYNYP